VVTSKTLRRKRNQIQDTGLSAKHDCQVRVPTLWLSLALRQFAVIGGIITAGQFAAIQGSGHAPIVATESAIIGNLPPGNYTAIVRGVNDTTGVALVEVYDLDQ
jgi:hypothetical protein